MCEMNNSLWTMKKEFEKSEKFESKIKNIHISLLIVF